MKLILDLDTGIDDAMALAYALGHPDAEVIGVTTIFGNVDTETATRNASAILKLFGREDIPVYPGERRAIAAAKDYQQVKASGEIHGENGLGNVSLEPGNNIQNENAVDYLLETAGNEGDDVTLVATGPLTNVARAIQKDPETVEKFNGIVSMGGALTVPGNVDGYAEGNYAKDVDADNIVFHSGIPVTMVGLDVTLRTLLTEEDIHPWQEGSSVAQTFYAMVHYYLQAYAKVHPELHGCALHDPLAVAVALDPKWVDGDQFCLMAMDDESQYGRIIQDQDRLNAGHPKNVRVALDINPEVFKDHFMNTIQFAFGL